MAEYFKVECGFGVFIVQADGIRQARSYSRRQYGKVACPFAIKKAEESDLKEHLRAGCVFFDAQGHVVNPATAYRAAGLPVPMKFQYVLGADDAAQ